MVGDISHGNKPTTGKPDHFDARETLDIRNRGQYRGLRIRRLPVEVKVLYSIGATDESIAATRFKQSVNRIVALEIGAFYNKSELIFRHVCLSKSLNRSAQYTESAKYPSLSNLSEIVLG